jgi:hypothetical protein
VRSRTRHRSLEVWDQGRTIQIYSTSIPYVSTTPQDAPLLCAPVQVRRIWRPTSFTVHGGRRTDGVGQRCGCCYSVMYKLSSSRGLSDSNSWHMQRPRIFVQVWARTWRTFTSSGSSCLFSVIRKEHILVRLLLTVLASQTEVD